ncbi:MAG: membrane bound O-acyl transferase family-domain-containing protein [Polyangiaceae bacterium]|nr:membrane bound O-acyl transferase family-domain-containing protein [Polyangiaceae bacterium]
MLSETPFPWANWLLCCLAIVGLSAIVAWLRPRSIGSRWCWALLVLILPIFFPSRGAVATFFTGLSVVVAVRLSDMRAMQGATRMRLFFWLLIPVLKEQRQPLSPQERWAYGGKLLLSAGFKLGLWQMIAVALSRENPGEWHWFLRSALLILFFVLNLTALSQLIELIVVVFGERTEPAFRAPFLSRSVREFWGRRWNRFISRFALRHIARPLADQQRSRALIGLTVFGASGVYHEYFAAGASGGAYVPLFMLVFFLVQGVAVLLSERLPQPPRPLGVLLSFIWMSATAPLFFLPLEVVLIDVGYPSPWFSFLELKQLLLT